MNKKQAITNLLEQSTIRDISICRIAFRVPGRAWYVYDYNAWRNGITRDEDRRYATLVGTIRRARKYIVYMSITMRDGTDMIYIGGACPRRWLYENVMSLESVVYYAETADVNKKAPLL